MALAAMRELVLMKMDRTLTYLLRQEVPTVNILRIFATAITSSTSSLQLFLFSLQITSHFFLSV